MRVSVITRPQNFVRFLCAFGYYPFGNGQASNFSSTHSPAFAASGSTTSAMWCEENRWSSNLNPLGPLYRLADRLRHRRLGDAGKHGEDLAHRYVRGLGLLVVARNWRPPQGGGEIDLIACETSASGYTLVFIEVKFRASGEWGTPERNVDDEKRIALRRAARDYVRRARADAERVRFDVIAITGGAIEHLRDAFPPI